MRAAGRLQTDRILTETKVCYAMLFDCYYC